MVEWRGWAIIAGLAGAILAAYTLRHGIVPAGDGVSYWSASVNVTHGHPLSSGLIPSFSDLSYRSLLANARAPFVDFPIGYPIIVGSIGTVIGVVNAQWLAMVVASAAIAALIVWGPNRASSRGELAVRALVAWVALGLPIAVQLRQGGLPETPFVAGMLGFALLILHLRRTKIGVLPAAAVAGMLGILRFVGLPLVLILAVESWRAGVRRWALARAIAICAAPGLANAWWTAQRTGRHPQWMHRSSIDFKFAAHSLGGWFASWRTSVDDVLSGHWSVPAPYYVLAAVTVVGIGVLSWFWVRASDGPGALLGALAGALLIAVIITMFLYDALTKFEPRMLYPPAVLLFAAWAWSSIAQQKLGKWAAVASLLWAALAASPTNWAAPRFQANAARAAAARSMNVKVLVSNSADLIHYETGIPAAYFPSPVVVHSGRPNDRDGLMDGFSCSLLRAHGGVLVDGVGYLGPDPWVIGYLDRFLAKGELTLAVSGPYQLYLPTDTACLG